MATPRNPIARTIAFLVGACALACGGGGDGVDVPVAPGVAVGETATTCPAQAEAATPLPGVAAEELELSYWIARLAADGRDPDEALLTPAEIEAQNVAITAGGEDLSFARSSLAQAPPRDVVEREVRERLAYVRERLADGQYVAADGSRADAALLARFDPPSAIEVGSDVRVALERIPLRCGPLAAALYSSPPDPAFDRNACSSIERQEPVQVLARWPGGMLLARTRYALGWIAADAPLSPSLDPDRVAAFATAPRGRARAATTLRSDDGGSIAVDPDVLLPLILPEDGVAGATRRVLFATANGIHASVAVGDLEEVARPLTRRAFLAEAFRHLGQPYGWGGREGGVDCSELVMDALATFGVEMPRHSARQAEAGSFAIDVPEGASDADRIRLIESAARRGVVLLHFPGHTMIWLGKNAAGQPRILHSFAEYLEPCTGGGETLRRVHRVSVSGLDLGRGTSRRAFVERITRIVVIGRGAGAELGGVAVPRPAIPVEVPEGDACTESVTARIFQSPAMPHSGAPLRFLVTTSTDPGPIDLALRDPSGQPVRAAEIHRLGGPPFTYWVEIPRPAPGRWTIAVGDGARVVSCDRVNVTRHPRSALDEIPLPVGPTATPVDPQSAIWVPRWTWEEDVENLYAAFVEQLFAYPPDDRTWTSLTQLLNDRDHNLLFGHLGMNEEARLELVPDCADLPYFLRAYFAWKLRLPFAFRRCSRGRAGAPPSCGEFVTTAIPHTQPDTVEAFRFFIERHLRAGVHSATGRTAPRDDQTDLYPVPMTREALRPGTVFADPYGHLLVVSAWLPQSATSYGSLMGADAQPDGTIGRRTFWRGTFLFTPDTTDVGAGFKAYRPVIYDRRADTWIEPTNDELRQARDVVPWSDQQYRGTVDDFYDRMESLINPREIDPDAMSGSLVDALEESVVRRVVSVDTGEQWVREHPGRTIEMPEGTDIFLTEGAWEDFSTPSRDMRLLVAIDTVIGFPDAMRRQPARWGLDEGAELEAAVARARTRITEELARRTFPYTRSDGSTQTLTLAELVAREDAIEIAWNPNDCPETRWGAPEGSPEASTCARHAPPEQRARMSTMRAWFANRQRPTR